jgi:hypothetical protein
MWRPSLPALAAAYRATGADPPFGDPRRAHGVGMEGYYWRITEPQAGTVVVALCGVSRDSHGSWGAVALAAQPDGFLRQAVVGHASADPRRLGGRAGDDPDRLGVSPGPALRGSTERLAVNLGDDARLDVRLHGRVEWPHRFLGGLGAGQVVPGLGQYWHPHLLGARVEGRAVLGDRVLALDGATAYGEKNWGGAFPRRWWWGQAHGFERADVCVAFAGGLLERGPLRASATAIVVRLGDQVVRLAPPTAIVRSEAGDGRWRVRARSPRHSIVLEGDGRASRPHRLPVPIPSERRTTDRAVQHLTARATLEVRERGRLRYRGVSELAGLEVGEGE